MFSIYFRNRAGCNAILEQADVGKVAASYMRRKAKEVETFPSTLAWSAKLHRLDNGETKRVNKQMYSAPVKSICPKAKQNERATRLWYTWTELYKSMRIDWTAPIFLLRRFAFCRQRPRKTSRTKTGWVNRLGASKPADNSQEFSWIRSAEFVFVCRSAAVPAAIISSTSSWLIQRTLAHEKRQDMLTSQQAFLLITILSIPNLLISLKPVDQESHQVPSRTT